MITGVHLVNWKSHLDSKLEFSQGVNALIGINGAGKSSVLDAMSFALFGTFPALKARRLVIEDLIMKKPDKKEYCTVEVDFSSNGSSYKVRRIVERGGGTSNAEIRKDGEKLQAGPELVTAEVVRALQTDYDMFSKAIYSEQNGMDYFLRVQKGKRMDEIDRMLKLDTFEDVRAGAVSIANRIKSASDEMLKVIADMEREDYGSKAESARKEITGMNAEKERTESEIKEAKESAGKLEKQLAVMEEVESEFNESKSALESVKSSLAEAQESLERRMKRLDGRNAAVIEKEKASIEKESSDMKEWISCSEKALQEKRQEIAELNGRLRVESQSAEKLQGLGAKCPVCESEISDDRKKSLCAKHREEAAQLRARSAKLAEEAAKLSEELESMSERMLSKQRELAKISALGSDIEEMAALEKRVCAYVKQKDALDRKVRELSEKYDREKLSRLRREMRAASESAAGLSSRLDMLVRRMQDKADSLKDIEERVSQIERYRKDAEKSADAIQGMEKFVKVLKLTQEQLRAEFLKTVNVIMADVWKILYPYGDFSGIRLSADDDYTLELQEPGGWVGVDSVSGGERSLAALALRIAFSRAFIPNLKWLILDEPTHNLDANAIRQFSEILREKMALFAEQVFIITHEDRISEGVTGNIYRLERDKENDGVTRIVAI